MLSPPFTGAEQSGGHIFETGSPVSVSPQESRAPHRLSLTLPAVPAPGPPPGFRLGQNRRFDLDGDGVSERYTLRRGILKVYAGSSLLWQSPEDWWVDYFFFGDINNDGLPELNLSVWKEGSFGPRRPFWAAADDASVKNHLFIYKLAGGRFKPVWQSSNLDCPNYWAILVDFYGGGENELAVVEGSYINPLKRKVTLWKWNGWGFFRTDRGDTLR